MSNLLEKYLNRYQAILANFSHLKVSLVDFTKSPYNLAIASARTCYSSKGIILPSEMEKKPELRDKIAESTMQAGHLTTRQHAHFVFAIEGVSRHVIWQFLHAHPYYNSEQVSQRYVEIKGNDWYTLPAALKKTDVSQPQQAAIDTYQKIIDAIKPRVEAEFFSIYRTRRNQKEKYKNHVQKKCMEIARYVMPISTTAYLYHTVNALTLYRYAHTMFSYNNDEITALVLKMLCEVEKIDPLLIREISFTEDKAGAGTMNAGFDENPQNAAEQNRHFDEQLKQAQCLSRLVSSTENPEAVLKEIWLSVGGQLSQEPDYLDKILNSEANRSLSETLYPVTLDPVARILNHLHFTFQKKLSHTADSQEQRHRTLPAARPVLSGKVSLEPDYITPLLIQEEDGVRKIYREFMEGHFEYIKKKHTEGHRLADLAYLLPNAFPVRIYESGDFLNFFHKWKARLCYTAQEEIFYSSLDEVLQVVEKYPFFEKYLGAPCALRKNTRPVCPEGDKYCGVKVWKLGLKDYSRKL